LWGQAKPTFETTAKAVFAAKCVVCHGAGSPQGGLDLRTAEAAMKGGKSGPSKNLLIDKIVTGQMPPGKVKLTDKEVDQVRAWIDRGAEEIVVAKVREQDARAVFQARCVRCHGGMEQQGGLDLRTVASRLKGGKSGPALVPGKPEESLIYKRIVAGQMPPDKMAKDFAVELPTDAETEKIRAWIAAGAPEPEAVPVAADAVVKADAGDFWSFQPPRRPTVPKQLANPIDSFVLTKLEAKGLKYAPEADRLTLLRRAYLDLIGMPPSKTEIAAYMADSTPGAYERVIDRLLASKHYGERWGQHWLDLAGYADSEGFGQDDGVRPYAWRYRDYVIRSLNADKPYSQFLMEQIAGDELAKDWKETKTANQDLIDRLAATGFLRTVPDPTNSSERGLISERMNIVADEVEVLASSVMGLTVGCARCHNHKYDPIPQRDYYRLSAILQRAYDPYEWKTPSQRELPLGLESEWKDAAEHNEPIEAEIKKVNERISKLSEPFKKQAIEERLQGLSDKLREDLRAALATAFSDRDLAVKYPELQSQVAPLQRQLDGLRGKMRPKPHVRILTDNAEPSLPFLLRRGEAVGFGDPVEPGVPGLFARPELKPYSPGVRDRRLALAQWLTQPNHPLTARVAVNQLWMRHFGRGIVPTVANFGHSGIAPSNQELLDWLATEFVESGWKLKTMHRLMMTSQAYRQSSRVDEKVLKADPDNALVSRMPLRRMDADTLYDSLVIAAGRLDATQFGKPADVEVTADKEVIVKPSKEGFRRNIYVLHRRQTPVSLMDSFDQPPMTPNCTERRQSNVATQALHMMNGSMTWDLAQFMAGRVIDESDGDRAKIVEGVYLRAYSRYPKAQEVETGIAAIEEFRREWPKRLEANNGAAPRAATAQWMAVANYCHAILNSAEFSFID
jgi:cytochrome c553